MQKLTQLRLAATFVHGLQLRGVSLLRTGSLGDYLQRLGVLGAIQNVVSTLLVGLAADGLIACGFLIVLLVTSPVLASITVAITGLGALVTFVLAKKQVPLIEQGNAHQALSSARFIELVSSSDVAAVMGLERSHFNNWYPTAERSAELARQTGVLAEIGEAVSVTIRIVAQLALFTAIWFLIGPPRDDVGRWVALVGLASACATQILFSVSMAGHLVSIRPLLWRVQGSLEFIGAISTETPPDEEEPDGAFESIVARDITLGVGATQTPLLQDVNFVCRRGELVALTGPSGVGKTSLMLALASGYGVISGEITYCFGSAPYGPAQVRSHLGYVPQVANLHDQTIEDFVRAGRSHVDEVDVRWALRLAELHSEQFGGQDILKVKLGSHGSMVSGGQAQRVAIARALAGRPDLLLLDEATNTIDESQEKLVLDSIRAAGIGAVMVSHRAATLSHCDRIYEVSDGRVVERYR